MKISGISLILFVPLLTAVAAQTNKQFDEVDINEDGILNIDEARQAFPTLEIVDANNDNVVNYAEIKLALPDLLLFPENSRDDNLPIRAAEFVKIASVLDDQGVLTNSSN